MTVFASPDVAQSFIDEPLPEWPRTWLIGALGALALHAGVAAFVVRSMQNDADELGAPALVIGIDLESPQREASDLPVGPDADASAPSPAAMAQKEAVLQSDQPRDVSTDSDDPDIVVSPADARKLDSPDTPAAQAAPSQPSAANPATAVPTIEGATPSNRSITPSQGIGASAVAERVTWEKELAAHFDKYKRYPGERAMQNAKVVVDFMLDRMGHVVSSHVAKSSGDSAFDAAALAMLQRADPVPPPPPLIADSGLNFAMPVIFHAKAQH